MVCLLHVHHLTLYSWGQEGGTKGFPLGQGVPPAGSTCCYVCVCAMCVCMCQIS